MTIPFNAFSGTFSDGSGDGSSSGSGSGGNNSACEMCGWLAAFAGMLAFGTFGVPIKSKVARSLDIDPLVMQSYKTTMCFLTSWLFILIRGEEFTFTPWGIISGISWVPGGMATIYAIKTAGLAIGIGVGSSIIVLVSFTWGIFVFGEHVHSRIQACSAVGCMLCGLAGMAYYSSPSVAHATTTTHNTSPRNSRYQPVRPDDPDFLRPDEDDDAVPLGAATGNFDQSANSLETDYIAMEDEANIDNDDAESASTAQNEEQVTLTIEVDDERSSPQDDNHSAEPRSVLCCFGIMRVQERTLGILAALVFTGIWGGSILVPMHFAPKMDKGLGYLISFAIGAAIVNLSLWLFRYLYLCYRYSSLARAYRSLPSFHFKKMWSYGGACGLLWSIGNFFSILAVEYLGEGVGYSATQASMLVSGLWGIFYFHEIEGMETISKWYLSAMVTVLGILLLSYEHHEK